MLIEGLGEAIFCESCKDPMTGEEVETFGFLCRECKLKTARMKAIAMLLTYTRNGEFYDEAVIDAVVDLFHYANAEGHDIGELVGTAKMHYDAEV